MLLALLLLASPADAATLHRCEVRLDLPVGVVEVPGFGHSSGEALAHARRAAGILASYHAHAELLGGLLADPAVALGRHVTALQTRDLTVDAPAPGYPIEDGDCTKQKLQDDPRAAWSVVWADANSPIVRSDVVAAIEGARRRVCFGSFQVAVNAALGRDDADRWRTLVTGLADARDHLLRCATDVSPEVAPAHAPLPEAPGEGLFACHRPRRHAGTWTTAPGYGSSLEAAREASFARDLLLVSRRSAADALAAVERSAGQQGVQEALDPLRTLVVGTDPVEQALLLCASGPPTSSAYAWTPAPGCGDPEDPIALVPSADALERLAGPRCDAVLAKGTSATVTQLSGPRKGDGTTAIRGLGAALRCAASCGSDGTVRGWQPVAVRRPGELDRSTGEAAAAELYRAVERRDLDAFGVLTGGVMLHPRFASVARKDPDAFWGSLEEAGRTGKLGDVAAWEHVAGQWLLTFR